MMMQNDLSYERYQRQWILPGFGEAAQRKLGQAKVLIIGAGGLGCPVLQYLSGAGVGMIGLIDDDVVSLSNLHRQPLYKVGDIGKSKASVAVENMRQMNPDISINAFPFRLTNTVSLDLFPGYDLIIDCSDNFATRYLVNDACVLLGKTLVSGAVSRYEGQVMVLNVAETAERVSYRDLFPDPPQAGEVQNCAEAGVLGALPGIIGSMMAAEVVKLIGGMGQALINRLLNYDMLQHRLFTVEISPNPDNTKGPATLQDFLATDYNWLCGLGLPVEEIDAEEFDRLIAEPGTLVVDVREQGEWPLVTEFPHRKHPLSVFSKMPAAPEYQHIIFFCQAGVRSLQAAGQYRPLLQSEQQVYSLRGGIPAWKSFKSRQYV